jgi:hypothetical protein
MNLGSSAIATLKLGSQQVSRVMLGSVEVWANMDADAVAYFDRITAAGSTISAGNKAAVNDFIVGCKADGIWTAIKASCLLAGPDDLTGALVPLVGTAPTNVDGNFVAGDYNRTTGLIGDGFGKNINSNRKNNDDPQNNNHNAVYITTGGTGPASGPISTDANPNSISLVATRSRSGTANLATIATGFIGISRTVSANYDRRNGGSTSTVTQVSTAPNNVNVAIFRFSDSFGNHRLSFYSIGESLNLALLDARLTTYMAAIT